MARNSPRRPPPRRPARPGRPPAGRRPPAPPLDDDPVDAGEADPLGGINLSSDFNVSLTRQEMTRRRDVFVVGVMTPALLVLIVAGLLGVSQLFYPDLEYVPPTPVLEAIEEEVEVPSEQVILEPIDPVRLNAGVNDRPPPFLWPEVDDLKLTVEPSRPNEQADYTPALAATELRRLIAVVSVNLTLHASPAFAQGAAAELGKSYGLRQRGRGVIDITGRLGYIPDDTGVGLVFTVGSYRIQLETIAASPPIRSSQRAEIEYQTLHLGDHIVRRIQETMSSGTRTGPEAAAVHWRDHITRSIRGGS